MKRLPVVFVMILAVVQFGFANTSFAQNIDDHKYVCMMQDSLQVKPGEPIVIDGKTYYGCCSMCAGKMKSEPSKYTKAKDPVSGAFVDKSTAFIFGHEGKAYYFESEANRAQFAKNTLTSLNILRGSEK